MAKARKQPRRILNCIPSQGTETDWGFETAVESGLVAAAPPIPAAKDLREPWWRIGNQGQTGSCVGWAAADSVIRWHFVKSGRLGKREGLSPRFVWMASKETDEFDSRPTTFIESAGTSLKAALDVARRFGVVRDAVLPFRSGNLYPGEARTFYAIAAQLRITAYFNLGRDPENWKRWLATRGPILTRLDVDSTWMNATSTKGKLNRYDRGSASGGHAVALVGYTRDRLIVRNSWGTAWGDKGVAYASLSYTAAAFTEAYGVEVP